MRARWRRIGAAAPRKATRRAAIFSAAALAVGLAALPAAARPAGPFEIPDTQYVPVKWSDLPGWAKDDHRAALGAFRASCQAISRTERRGLPASRQTGQDQAALQDANKLQTEKALTGSLHEPCAAVAHWTARGDAQARIFFERYFRPVSISRLGDKDGFVTGYFEPVVEGSRTRTDVYTVPVYRRPSNLFVRGYSQASPSLPNKGEVFRKIGRRKLVPYFDRAAIEDGAIAGRGLELAWLKNQTDLLFMQIQGSARIRFEDGSMLRINYDSHNGHPYLPVGRVLIERNIIPREKMSMQRIRDWMTAHPLEANDVRRQNRAYVFFREVNLSDKDEPIGAQGVPLTAGRSIAVDRFLHLYGTLFFISGELPIETPQSRTPFQRLMVAQDTGSAIIGPARADIYFGAGAEAGSVSGRLRHNASFAMLVPKNLDPVRAGRRMPLPKARPVKKTEKKITRRQPRAARPSP
ncbi:MAG TPA: MltA domain-containing protein [Xanthobacteraceae bacterium]|nr:MltA domain-containing protein [Xanthobacteraceae bacterium]